MKALCKFFLILSSIFFKIKKCLANVLKNKMLVRIISLLAVYLVFIAIFALWYLFIDKKSNFHVVIYNNEEYRDFLPVKRAFIFSDSLQNSRKIEVVNSLGISAASSGLYKIDDYYVGNTTAWTSDVLPLNSWSSVRRFIESSNIPNNQIADEIDDVIFNVVMKNKKPSNLIENEFPRFSKSIFVPNRSLLNEDHEYDLRYLMKKYKINADFMNELSEDDRSLFEKRRLSVFSNIDNAPLDFVSRELLTLANEFSSKVSQPEVFKEGLYAYFMIVSSYVANVDISRERFEPNYLDFIYFSWVYATTSGGGEIVPNKTSVRLIASVQIMLTHVFLGIFIFIVTSRKQ
jgi:hypothetical protein